MAHLCMLVSIVSGDAHNALQSLGSDALSLVSSRWYPGSDTNGPPDYRVWSVGGVACTSGTNPKTGAPLEVLAGVIVGCNQDVPSNVQNLVANFSAFYEKNWGFNPALTRAAMFDRLVQSAGEQGCGGYWEVQPGNNILTGINTPADLLAKFTLFS